jgi:hypothetical protein
MHWHLRNQNVFGAEAAAVATANPQKNARVLIATYQTLGVASEDGDASFLIANYPRTASVTSSSTSVTDRRGGDDFLKRGPYLPFGMPYCDKRSTVLTRGRGLLDLSRMSWGSHSGPESLNLFAPHRERTASRFRRFGAAISISASRSR